MPLEIPAELAVRARKLNIKEIYFLKDANLAEYGIYGNHIVIVKGGMYIDFDICPINSVEAILDLIS